MRMDSECNRQCTAKIVPERRLCVYYMAIRCDATPIDFGKKQEFNQNTHAIQMRAYSNGRRLIVFGCMKDPLHTRRDPYTLFRHGKWEIPHVRIGLMCMRSKRKGSKTRNQTTIRIFPFDRERSRNHLRWAPKPPKEKSVPIFEPASESSEIHYTLNVEWETIYIGTPCRGFGFSFFFSFVWRRKFCDMFKIYEAQTESVSGKKHTVSDFLQLLRLLSLILTLSPLVWLRIYSSSSKQSTNSNLRQRHAFILLSLFRTSLHILALKCVNYAKAHPLHSIHFDHDLLHWKHNLSIQGWRAKRVNGNSGDGEENANRLTTENPLDYQQPNKNQQFQALN